MDLSDIEKKSVEIAAIMKNLAHQKRLLLLCNLIEGRKTVSELCEGCNLSQSQASQFLKRMELEKLLSSEREGNFIFYKIQDKRLVQMMKQIKKIFC